MADINNFNPAPERDGTAVTSTIDLTALKDRISTSGGDVYFDENHEFNAVYVSYLHEDGRQKKRFKHTPPGLTASAIWSPRANDGTWLKTRVRCIDNDGATHILGRGDIGTSEDLILS